MLRVDRWLRQGLTGPSQRNEAFLDLTWFFRVIWHFDEERAIQELWAWIQQYHNRQSEEYNRDPGEVFKKVRAVVRCFNWDKVGMKSSDKGHRKGPNTGDSLEGSIQAHLDAAPLDARERALSGRSTALCPSPGPGNARWLYRGPDSIQDTKDVRLAVRTDPAGLDRGRARRENPAVWDAYTPVLHLSGTLLGS